jgi:hypothetical protein
MATDDDDAKTDEGKEYWIICFHGAKDFVKGFDTAARPTDSFNQEPTATARQLLAVGSGLNDFGSVATIRCLWPTFTTAILSLFTYSNIAA